MGAELGAHDLESRGTLAGPLAGSSARHSCGQGGRAAKQIRAGGAGAGGLWCCWDAAAFGCCWGDFRLGDQMGDGHSSDLPGGWAAGRLEMGGRQPRQPRNLDVVWAQNLDVVLVA